MNSTPTTDDLLSRCESTEVHTFGVMIEAVARLSTRFDRHFKEELGISQSFFEALLRLERSGGMMTMSELASQISITGGGVTRLVDRMTAAGLVARESCAEDRRVHWIKIEPAGREMLGRAMDIHLADLRRWVTGHMSESERQVVVSVMERIRADLDGHS